MKGVKHQNISLFCKLPEGAQSFAFCSQIVTE